MKQEYLSHLVSNMKEFWKWVFEMSFIASKVSFLFFLTVFNPVYYLDCNFCIIIIKIHTSDFRNISSILFTCVFLILTS